MADDTLDAFDYVLPRDRIAQHPPPRRDAARLMVLDRGGGPTRHLSFADLPSLLREGDVVVLNDSRVVPARLRARRAAGGLVQVLLVDAPAPGCWRALIDTPRRLRDGEALTVGPATLRLRGRGPDGLWRVEGPADLMQFGEPPLPPYIKRPDGPTPEDRERYQTVYARAPGSIAAPTAGLHFTEAMLAALPVPVVRLTLHIGVGTFQPIRADRLADHRMESERYRIEPEALRQIESARRVVAVGTSVTRALEAQARTGLAEAATDLFIRPPFEFRRVGALLTNFHLPRGTPLALVSAFAGRERVLAAYAEALERGYRFYSYGDAMIVL
jgi:S-adenosylmethionine:tRNA ribosyltransferase-isomerase